MISKVVNYILYGFDSSGGFWKTLTSPNNLVHTIVSTLVIFVVIPLILNLFVSAVDFVLAIFTGRIFVFSNFLKYIKRRYLPFRGRYTEAVREDEDERELDSNLMSNLERNWILKRRKKRLEKLTAFWYMTCIDSIAAKFNLEGVDFLYQDYSLREQEEILKYIKKYTSLHHKPDILDKMYEYVEDAEMSLFTFDVGVDSEIDEVNRYIQKSDDFEEVFAIMRSYYKKGLDAILYVNKHDRDLLNLARELV